MSRRNILAVLAFALISLFALAYGIGSAIQSEPPSVRIERACANEHPGDPAGAKRCELRLLVSAIESDDHASDERARSGAGM